jgi:hypothetical protein
VCLGDSAFSNSYTADGLRLQRQSKSQFSCRSKGCCKRAHGQLCTTTGAYRLPEFDYCIFNMHKICLERVIGCPTALRQKKISREAGYIVCSLLLLIKCAFSLSSFFRDLSHPERRQTSRERHQVCRRLPREAHQTEREGGCPSKGAPKGRTLLTRSKPAKHPMFSL